MNRIQVFTAILLFFSLIASGNENRIIRSGASNLLSNGWHFAASTEGGFSVQVPWPFQDVTFEDDIDWYGITSVSSDLTKYSVIYMPNGSDSGVLIQFAKDLDDPRMVVGKYLGHVSIEESEVMEEDGIRISIFSKRVKTDLGIYILIAMALEHKENYSEIKRFYDSLVLAVE